MVKKYNLIFILLVILAAIPSVLALFHPGFFQTADGTWMIIRFSAFHQALRDGQFPVRFLGRLNFGYGYPVADFLYPGFMYLAEIPKVLGFGFINSIKIILGLSIITSAIFVYFWLAKLFDRLSSLLGALIYIYVPYYLYDLYNRGSVGEVLALSVVPFILWQIERKSFFWTTVGLGFLVLSHNTLAVLFLPLIIFYLTLDVLNSSNKRVLIYRYASMLALGLGLASFFWLPAIFDLQYTIFQKTPISDFNMYFVGINLIGFSTLFIFLLTFVLFLIGKIKFSKHRLTVLLFIIGIISVFFATSLSVPLWKILPVSFIQFPFRFLSIAILCAAFLVAFAISVLPNRAKIIMVLLIFVLAFLSSKSYLIPSQFFERDDLYYSTNEGTTTVQNEYMPKWVKNQPNQHFKEKVELIEGKANINNLDYNSKQVVFDINSSGNSKVRINTIYFPGWKSTIDGNPSNIEYTNDRGVIDLSVPKGEHKIKLKFSETPLRLLADLISLFSLIILIGITLKAVYIHRVSS